MANSPEIMRTVAGTEQQQTGLAVLVQQRVAMTPEIATGRLISIQRDLVGTHGTRFIQHVF
jgi:hypothetical protein